MLKNAISATSKADWLTHIRSLGLSSVGEYERWCRKHGFAFNRRKTWRQEREERTIAERERAASKALHHIRALGLKSADEYQLWCQQNGFRDALDKKRPQRERELLLFQRHNEQPQAAHATVTLEHIRTLGLEAIKHWPRLSSMRPWVAP